jgi:hypothetical protein
VSRIGVSVVVAVAKSLGSARRCHRLSGLRRGTRMRTATAANEEQCVTLRPIERIEASSTRPAFGDLNER